MENNGSNEDDSDIKITCRLSGEYVCLEGDKESLSYLANWILEVCSRENDCREEISPFGCGGVLFSKHSTRGIAIHRTPCEHGNLTYFPWWRRTEFVKPVMPVAFDEVFERVKQLWTEAIDVSDGYQIKETSGFYSAELAKEWTSVENRVDPTNDWDLLMVWCQYGEIHKLAKELNGLKREISVNSIIRKNVKDRFESELSGEGWEELFNLYKSKNY